MRIMKVTKRRDNTISISYSDGPGQFSNLTSSPQEIIRSYNDIGLIRNILDEPGEHLIAKKLMAINKIVNPHELTEVDLLGL